VSLKFKPKISASIRITVEFPATGCVDCVKKDFGRAIANGMDHQLFIALR
jgi:hypothetical protein